MKALAPFATFLVLALAAPSSYPGAQQCNGHADLCHRKYSNITFIGAHDSPFVGSTADLATNQNVDVTAQLDAGIRFLSAQIHQSVLGSTLDLCHTSCLEYDAGPLETYLASIKTWMDANPDNVLTLLLVNGGFYNVSLYGEVFEAAGLADYAYIPSTHHTHSNPNPNNTSPTPLPTLSTWPTLGAMITSTRRLVILMDYNANTTLVPYILPEFDLYFETPYDTTDPTFPECTLNRPPGGSPEGRMYGVNHFLDSDVLGTGIDVPDNRMDAQTNAAQGPGSIGAQATLCAGLYGAWPNFVLVDRFDTGDVFAAQMAMNFPPKG